MNPFETRLKSLALRAPSTSFGRPETLDALREIEDHSSRTLPGRIHSQRWLISALSMFGLAAAILLGFFVLTNPSGTSIAFGKWWKKSRQPKRWSSTLFRSPKKVKARRRKSI